MLWAWKVTKHCTGVFRWLRAWFLRAYLPFQLASHSFWASVHVDAYPAVRLSWWSDGGRCGRGQLKRRPAFLHEDRDCGTGRRPRCLCGRCLLDLPSRLRRPRCDLCVADVSSPPTQTRPHPGHGVGGTLETDRPGAGTEGRHGRAPLRARQGPCWEPNPRGAGRRVR